MNGQSNTIVVLVHGLWMRGIVLSVLRWRLSRIADFSVRSFSYPSVCRGLDANRSALSDYISSTHGNTIHLVGHSLGGLVILNMLAQEHDARIGRVVLMGTPSSGSHCASTLLRTPWLSKIVGRSIRDSLLKIRWDLPNDIEIGVLSGDRSIGLGRLIPGLPRPNDGVVSVVETRLAESRDNVTLPVSHSEMLISPSCAAQVAGFLENGRFFHG
jgi:pimeloyl-ACP methyl ester carboxylesterase